MPGPSDVASVVATVRALGVQVHESVFGTPRRMTDDAGLAFFRIAQEALTNAIRHGDRTAPISMETDWGEQAVVLVVTNGMPARIEPATERSGHGIDGMFRVRGSLPVLPGTDPEEDDEVTDAISRLLASGARAS